MRAVRPRRLEQVVPFAAAAEPADLIDTFSRLSACSFMVMVCDFQRDLDLRRARAVHIRDGAHHRIHLGGFGEKWRHGRGGGSVFGVADTVEVVDGFASGSVLRSIRRPESEGGFAGALPAEAGAAGGCGRDIRATRSPALSAVARSLADSLTRTAVLRASSGWPSAIQKRRHLQLVTETLRARARPRAARRSAPFARVSFALRVNHRQVVPRGSEVRIQRHSLFQCIQQLPAGRLPCRLWPWPRVPGRKS